MGTALTTAFLASSIFFLNPLPAFGDISVSTGTLEVLELLREEQGLELFQLGELVPSTEQPLGPLSRVYEITAQDILDMNARNVGEALRFIPGVIFGQGGPRNEGSVVIRGVGPRAGLSGDDKKYSVFVDGRPVYEPFLGTVDLFHLPVDNIAKIKVVKGPADAPYGPNTLGGVINITTKRGGEKPTTRATVSYERHNTQDYWVERGGQHNKWNYYVTGSARRSNGFPLANDFTTTSFENGGLREQSSFTKYNVSLNLGYDFNETDRLALLAGFYKAEADIPVPTTGYKVFASQFTRFTNWSRYFVDLSGQKKLSDKVSIRGKVYFDKFDNDLTFFTDQSFSAISVNPFSGGQNISVFDNYTLGMNLQATIDVSSDLRLKAGTFLKQDVVNRQRDTASIFENYETFTTDFFFQAEYLLRKNLMISAGVNWDTLYTLNSFIPRTDEFQQIHSFNPTGSIIYQPWTATRLHAAVAKRSNMPRMQNLFGQRAGEITLEPENNLTFEVGVTQQFLDNRLEAEVTYFQNKLDNIIEFQDRPGGLLVVPSPIGPVNSFVQFANSDSFTTRGVEVILSAKLTKELSAILNYTYMNTISEARGASLDKRFTGENLDPSSPMLERPKHQVNLVAKYVSSFGLSGFLQGSYISESFDSKALGSDPFPQRFDHNQVVRVQGFFLINGKISYEIYKGIKPFLYWKTSWIRITRGSAASPSPAAPSSSGLTPVIERFITPPILLVHMGRRYTQLISILVCSDRQALEFSGALPNYPHCLTRPLWALPWYA